MNTQTYIVHYSDGTTVTVQSTSKVRAAYVAPHKGKRGPHIVRVESAS